MKKNFSQDNITFKSTMVFILLVLAGLYVLTHLEDSEILRGTISLFLFAGAFVALGINDDFAIRTIKSFFNRK